MFKYLNGIYEKKLLGRILIPVEGISLTYF